MAGRLYGNLTPELTSFVGRRGEVAQVRSLFAKSRLVTLNGVGGVGKSRLAMNVATRLVRALPGGAWIVELAKVSEDVLVADATAQALGIVSRDGDTIETKIVERLRAKPSLLLLDNCEHLLGGCRELVTTLRNGCPRLRILVTSREPLRLPGEVTLALAPLGVPQHVDGSAGLEALLAFGAVELFAERAHAADPAFELTRGNAQSVVEICRRVAGIPLGLELAAVRVRTLPLAELVRRLDDQLSLVNLATIEDQRHATLMSTLDVSHDLITEREQILWRRLSIFASSFTLDSALEVVSDEALPASSLFDSLTSLIEKSIVSRFDEQTPERYRLLEPIRLYGRQRLAAAGEQRELELRHRRWCSELAVGEGPWWTGVAQLGWVRRLNAEQAEIHAALDASVRDPDCADEGLALAADAWAPYIVQDRYGGVRHYIERLLQHAQSPTVVRAQALHAAAYIAMIANDFGPARLYGNACEELSRESGFNRELGLACFVLGLVDIFEFREEEARARFQQARHLLESTDAVIVYAAVLNILGGHFRSTDTDESLRLIRESLAVLDATDDLWMKSMAYQRLAHFEWLQGNLDAAEAGNRTVLRMQRELGYRFGVAWTLEELAWVATSIRNAERSAQLLGAAEALRQELTTTIPEGPLRDYHDGAVTAAKAALGNTRYRTLHARGADLTYDLALSLALDEDPATQPRVEPADSWVLLTPRERQVAELVATGATNPQIAAALLITRATVKTHVEHILAKLGVENRTDVAVWVASHQTTTSI